MQEVLFRLQYIIINLSTFVGFSRRIKMHLDPAEGLKTYCHTASIVKSVRTLTLRSWQSLVECPTA